MKKLNLSIQLVIRILLILAAVLAVSSLPMTYGIARSNYLPSDFSFQVIRGIEMLTSFCIVGIQVVISGLVLFVVARKWVNILVLVAALLQVLGVLIIVRLEIVLRWLMSSFSVSLGWGYWLLLIASVLVVAGCILNFFVKQFSPSNDQLIDDLH